ncbi:ABC transporter permease [Hymenobacter latericus]|uniref:ABC transporter permease n=1 Tax=Hymenobacter sp. YIM 151858-1 TaxID=2987688 RepID=UPI002226677F|nr:ABC transporter permease [Hymenobacter sp. YIM 151858-1]UYZ57910.1 ABC transporter permease [Hymenobacter sp. YIM 151858-1]
MLLSYLKIAWKVLLRRKFFTFISLFGISFTLMVMLVLVAAVDHFNGSHKPEKRMDRMLFVNLLSLRFKDGGSNNTPVSAHFINTYVRPMKTPELVGFTSVGTSATAFAGNQTLTLDVRHTDYNFWRVMDFDFVDGRTYTAAEIDQKARVCVISRSTARSFFGTEQGAAGRTLEIGPHRYRVTGVVPDVPAIRLYSSADVWVPYTLNASSIEDNRYDGSYFAILLAPTRKAVPAMRAEFQQVMRRVPLPDPARFNKMFAHADPALAGIVRQLTSNQDSDNDGMGLFLTVCGVLALLFMLLPALNLVNLNVTRIMERAGEIGVRKAFGASRSVLVGQFLTENLVLTALGGLIGLGLAAGGLHLLNESQFIAHSHFGLSWRAFGTGLGLTVIFGLMSGVYPAWKMSRLNPVDALRGSAGGPR